MANVKITELTALTDPASTDVLPIVDVAADATKKVTIADLLENASSGSASAPAFAFDADSDTGIYRPGADQLALATNGTGRLFISSSGNVGIGIATPSFALDVLDQDGIRIRDSQSIRLLRLIPANGAGNVPAKINNSSSLGLNIETGGNIAFKNANSTTEYARIDSSGNVGIGTTSPSKKLSVAGDILASSLSSNGDLEFNCDDNANNAGNDAIIFKERGTEKMRMDGSGRLLLGTSSTQTDSLLVVEGQSGAATGPGTMFLARGSNNPGDGNGIGQLFFTDTDHQSSQVVPKSAASVLCQRDGGTWTSGSSMPGRLVFSTTADGASSPTERMRINSDNSVDIGANATASDDTTLTVGSFTRRGIFYGKSPSTGYTGASLLLNNVDGIGSTVAITYGGDATFAGALSKGSGSFKISHPLLEKTETHYLYHSFIEGPQADLIYRGHVQLVNGAASVNIDEAARMTEGTFEALCTNVCCFTSNESDWTAVRGSVSGNILTIEAQDSSSTADVCWMVVGERKDQHMLDTDWTDENGRVITERLKSEVDIPEAN